MSEEQEEVESVENGIVSVIVLIGLGLVVAGLVEALPPKILERFPQSVLVLILGLVAGLLGIHFSNVTGNTRMAELISGLEIDPEGIQLIFLPPLIFSELFKMNVHVFLNVSWQAILLAFPGVLISMCLTALFPIYILPNEWGWYEALAFGGMLAATDPVAVLAILHSLNASKHLSTIIAGESVLNDGSAIVVVTLFLNLQAGQVYYAGDVIAFSFRETLGSVALGTACGLAMMAIFPLLKNNPTPLVALTFGVPYLCFAAALAIDMSGVLSLVPLGLICNAWGRATIVGAVADRMEHFWDQAEFFANSVLFGIAGLYIADDLLEGLIKGYDWGFLFLLYVLLMVIRGIAVTMLYPAMYKLGYGFNVKEAIVTTWGGLRGAVGLTLSFAIRGTQNVSDQVGQQATFYMGGIVILTLMVNATTSGPLIQYFNLQRSGDKRILAELENDFKGVAEKSLLFAGATDEQIESVTGSSHSSEPAHHAEQSDNKVEETLAAKRRHFLLAQAVTFDHLLSRGVIPRGAWFLAMQSIDVELDKRDSEIAQWRTVVKQPLLKLFVKSISDETLKKFLSAKNVKDEEFLEKESHDHPDPPTELGRHARYSLTLISYIAFAYLRAHEDARAALDAMASEADLLGQQRAALHRESLQDCRAPAKFLSLVRARHPDILQSIKAVQLSTAIRWDLLDRAARLADLGLLEHSELHPLVELADHISQKCSALNLALKADKTTNASGDFSKNPDFYPFPALASPIKSRGSIADIELSLTDVSEPDRITATTSARGGTDIRGLESRILDEVRNQSHWYGS
mmetsp:Transcript_17731/g.34942  ORF Transcript_17731/g.34942 Transcript_17731/m.34942 type:complete len:802 (-) Transcript_17731:461-2866(-)